MFGEASLAAITIIIGLRHRNGASAFILVFQRKNKYEHITHEYGLMVRIITVYWSRGELNSCPKTYSYIFLHA